MLFFAGFLTLCAILLFWLASRQRRSIGLPAGRVIYSDTQAWKPVEKPLYDRELGLTGKPDYLLESRGQIIPVEVKSSRVSEGPYDGHIFQLAAYCLLVQRQIGKRPPYGILHYPNRTYAIDFTPELEQTTLDLLDEMHHNTRRKELARSHEVEARCRRCGYRGVCDQKLM
ncbi:MAG: CRISPR-associated protein Cas4 [Anaerolineae bacterium UTCFX2]|jgi:CRISPR-associated exonuclease Cas4|nr:CRISPR-associated protein Cas4 [Anaerolineae bacterium]MCZ7553115.1 CRISPR-associated protein Cas4 [Anaerolineales bacterium]OQY94684.1 MAG: CRISPR-associated protein Cas4 [Anaerolineae bacterium UTCFX2]